MCDRLSEASTHGNLAYAYHGLGLHNQGVESRQVHLRMSREINDRTGEMRALVNLANHYCAVNNYTLALQYYKVSDLVNLTKH